MKISKLLASRQALLRQTQLANIAYAYDTLQRFALRIANASLRGLVKLHPADPADDCFWASLTALEGNQSVLEEHFSDQDLIELAEVMAFATNGDFSELTFRIEDLGEKYASPLRILLEQSGVTIDGEFHPSKLAPDSAE